MSSISSRFLRFFALPSRRLDCLDSGLVGDLNGTNCCCALFEIEETVGMEAQSALSSNTFLVDDDDCVGLGSSHLSEDLSPLFSNICCCGVCSRDTSNVSGDAEATGIPASSSESAAEQYLGVIIITAGSSKDSVRISCKALCMVCFG